MKTFPPDAGSSPASQLYFMRIYESQYEDTTRELYQAQAELEAAIRCDKRASEYRYRPAERSGADSSGSICLHDRYHDRADHGGTDPGRLDRTTGKEEQG